MARILTRAFHDDPVQRYLFPEERVYERRGRANFELVVRRSLEVGVGYVGAGIEGASLWIAPGADFVDGWRGLVFALRSLRVMRGRLQRSLRFIALLARHHPHEPHWYLPILGTDPAHQRCGFGSALLAPMLARADREGLPVYLESSKPQNVPFYQRHGFEVVRSVRIEGGPEIWPMLRKPR